MNGPEVCTGAPGGGLVAESCKVIQTARPRTDAKLIERACTVAARCHHGRKRYSGDPYITHPVAVAGILARLQDADVVDDPTLCAAILHNTVEDTPYTLAALKRDFGSEIALMVTQIMALDHLGGGPAAQHADSAVPPAAQADAQGEGSPRYLRPGHPAPRHRRFGHRGFHQQARSGEG